MSASLNLVYFIPIECECRVDVLLCGKLVRVHKKGTHILYSFLGKVGEQYHPIGYLWRGSLLCSGYCCCSTISSGWVGCWVHSLFFCSFSHTKKTFRHSLYSHWLGPFQSVLYIVMALFHFRLWYHHKPPLMVMIVPIIIIFPLSYHYYHTYIQKAK